MYFKICAKYDKWHIYHIKPLSKFKKSKETSIVNSLENNLSKGDKYE